MRIRSFRPPDGDLEPAPAGGMRWRRRAAFRYDHRSLPNLQELCMSPLPRMSAALAFASLWLCHAGLSAPLSDHPYGGELTLTVDLSNPSQRILRVHERIPVKSGAFTLYYPKW